MCSLISKVVRNFRNHSYFQLKQSKTTQSRISLKKLINKHNQLISFKCLLQAEIMIMMMTVKKEMSLRGQWIRRARLIDKLREAASSGVDSMYSQTVWVKAVISNNQWTNLKQSKSVFVHSKRTAIYALTMWAKANASMCIRIKQKIDAFYVSHLIVINSLKIKCLH